MHCYHSLMRPVTAKQFILRVFSSCRAVVTCATVTLCTTMLVSIGEAVNVEREMHPVHISSTQIDLSGNARSLEVSVRIFTDDLEEALFAASNRRVRFGTTPPAAMDSVLGVYLASRLKFMPDGRTANARLLGHEREADAVLAFIEVPVTRAPARLEIENTILLELFSDQSNIVHATVGTKKRNALLRRGEERASLNFN
jgi:hypothetical protein